MFTSRLLAKSLLRAVRSTSRRSSTVRLGLDAFEDRVVPAIYVWQGIAGQAVTWNTPDTWQDLATGAVGSAIPGPNDTARFTNASAQDCYVQAAQTVGSLEVQQGFTKQIVLNNGLTVKGGSLNTTTPTGANSTIIGPSNLVIDTGATFTWSSGTMAGSGPTVVNSGTILNITSSTTDTLDARLAGRTLQNEGTINLSSGRIFVQEQPGVPTIQAAIINHGQFNITGTASSILGGSGAGSFTNEGQGKVVVNLAQTSTFRVDQYFSTTSAPTGADAVTVQGGSLWVRGGGLSTSRWAVFSDAGVEFGDAPVPNSNPPQFVWNTGTYFGGANGKVTVGDTRILVSNAAGQSITFDTKLNFLAGKIQSSNADSKLLLNNSFSWGGGVTEGNGTIELASASAGGPRACYAPIALWGCLIGHGSTDAEDVPQRRDR